MQTPLRGAHPTIDSLSEIRVKFIEIRVVFYLGCSSTSSSSSQDELVLTQPRRPFQLQCVHHLRVVT